MAKYKWNLDDIVSNYKFYLNSYIYEENPELKMYAGCLTDFYRTLLTKSVNQKKQNSIRNFDYYDEDSNFKIDDIISFYDVKEYRESIKLLTRCGNSINSHMKELNGIKIINKRIKISNDELVNTILDFLEKMTFKPLDDIFMEIIDNNSLNINYSKYLDNYYGRYYSNILEDNKYIEVIRSNRMIDYVTLVHEVFHYIYDSDIYGVNDIILGEVESYFAELLFSKYYRKYHDDKEVVFDADIVDSISTGINSLCVGDAVYNSVSNNYSFRLNKANKLLNKYGIIGYDSKKDMLNDINDDIETDIRVSLGSLVAIDLANIYDKDPEKSFHLLYNIKCGSYKKSLKQILKKNEMTFMDDGCENYKKLVNNIKKRIS